jgi:hypothetical protein
MRSSPAMPIIVAVVGAIACLLAIILPYFLLIQPTQGRIDAANARFQAAFNDSTPTAHAAAQKSLDDANASAADIRSQWHVKEKTLMPPFDVSHRDTAWKQLAHELSENLGPSLERWMSHAGVVQLSSIAIQAPPNSPNGITGSPIPVPVNSSGTMTVGGDFRSLLAHVLKWNDFNRLVLIDQLKLAGNSPNMQATYSATVFIFPQNGDKLGATIAKSGVGGATAGGFGGGGYGGGAYGAGGGGRGYGGPPAGYGGR